MDQHVTLDFFSIEWTSGWILSALFIWFVISVGKRLNESQERKFRILFASFLIIRHIVLLAIYYKTGVFDISTDLPLHMCGISSIISAIILVNKKIHLFEFVLLLGSAGALQSFITPELTHGISGIKLVDYYFSHSSIILCPLYLFFVHDLKVRKRAWLNVFIMGNIILACVGFINWLISANYIYLCERPIANNPLLIGEWPLYLIGFEIFGFINIYLFYLLFTALQKRRSKIN